MLSFTAIIIGLWLLVIASQRLINVYSDFTQTNNADAGRSYIPALILAGYRVVWLEPRNRIKTTHLHWIKKLPSSLYLGRSQHSVNLFLILYSAAACELISVNAQKINTFIQHKPWILSCLSSNWDHTQVWLQPDNTCYTNCCEQIFMHA